LQFRREDILKHLGGQTDFTVVGVIGREGVGKSTVLSQFAPQSTVTPEKQVSFVARSVQHTIRCCHCTTGIDAIVTEDRSILLDCQPVLSTSILQQHKLYSAISPASAQMECHIQDVQLVLFMLSVCHVVLVIQDAETDPDLVELIDTAMLLRKTLGNDPMLVPDQGVSPDLVFIYNRIPDHLAISKRLVEIQQLLDKQCDGARFRRQGALHMYETGLTAHTAEITNATWLPLCSSTETKLGVQLGGLDRRNFHCRRMVERIRTMHKLPSASATPFKEVDWLSTAALFWDEVRQGISIGEYRRLLQTAS
jgi:hypothetical protein